MEDKVEYSNKDKMEKKMRMMIGKRKVGERGHSKDEEEEKEKEED